MWWSSFQQIASPQPGIAPLVADGGRAIGADKSTFQQHDLSNLIVGPNQLKYRLPRTRKPKSHATSNTKCPITHTLCPLTRRRVEPPVPTAERNPGSSEHTQRAGSQGSGLNGGRYWDRTSDLFRVKEARYPCANRPRWVRDSNPCIRLCRPLPRLSANPPLPMGSCGFPIESG